MMDNKMIVEGSLANYVEDGVVKGVQVKGRLPYYRGLGLSMVEDIALEIDGEPVAREHIRFSVRGKTYTLDEMETVYDDRWNYAEKATIVALKEGGLAPGDHSVTMAVRMRVSYLPFVPTTKFTRQMALAA